MDHKFILLENTNNLGMLSLNHDHHKIMAMASGKVLRITQAQYNIKEIKPGLLVKGEFKEVPLQICNIIISSFVVSNSSSNNYLIGELIIFDKNNLNNHTITVKVKGSSNVEDFVYLINGINYFVHEENAINKIYDCIILNDRLGNIFWTKNKACIRYLERISFKFYENSSSRPGKDNSFWTDVEMTGCRNLTPNDCYLFYLLIKAIYKIKYSGLRFEKNYVSFDMDHSYAYSASFARKELKISPEDERNLYLNIITEMVSNYNHFMHIYPYFSELAEMNYNIKYKT